MFEPCGYEFGLGLGSSIDEWQDLIREVDCNCIEGRVEEMIGLMRCNGEPTFSYLLYSNGTRLHI